MNKKKFIVYILLGLNLVGLLGNIAISLLITKKYNIELLIGYIILVLFILFLSFYISNTKKDTFISLDISMIFLLFYNILLLNNSLGFINISYFKTMPNFVNKSYVEVVKWANKNDIKVNEEYEYSNVIKEYDVIYQDVEVGKNLSKIDSLNIVISEGKNPKEEIIIPDMTGYNLDKVIEYVEENNLTNVKIEYEKNDIKEDDLIKQSIIGNMERDKEITFTFSRGLNDLEDKIALIDFSNMSKLRATAYLVKYELNYKFNEDYSNTIKKNYVINQNIKKGVIVDRLNDEIVITISKGKKIKVPNFNKMSLEEITNWAIRNKIKLEINKEYDDSIKEGKIISSNVSENDVLCENDMVKITISKGKLLMKNFNNLEDFKAWAEKNNVVYTIEYEFSENVNNGDIIKFSHKENDTIKNNDTVTVYVSNGNKVSVPNFIGMSLKDISTKCKKINLKCSFQYQNSNKKKDIALRQSLSAGSYVSEGSSISIILSNGNKQENTTNKNTTQSKQNTNTNSNTSNNSTSSNNSNQSSEPSCEVKSITLARELNNMLSEPESYQSSYDKLSAYFASINVKINIIADESSPKIPGSYVSGIGPGTIVTTCCPNDCKTYSITISK